jgi:hypothetical protein
LDEYEKYVESDVKTFGVGAKPLNANRKNIFGSVLCIGDSHERTAEKCH